MKPGIFSMVDNFCDFLFAFQQNKILWKRSLLQMEKKHVVQRRKFFPTRVNHFAKRSKNNVNGGKTFKNVFDMCTYCPGYNLKHIHFVHKLRRKNNVSDHFIHINFLIFSYYKTRTFPIRCSQKNSEKHVCFNILNISNRLHFRKSCTYEFCINNQ